MKKPVDFDWYCKTKKDVINNAAYELIVALTAKSAPPRKFELWHSSTRISPASFQHISLIRDIVFFCTSKVVL